MRRSDLILASNARVLKYEGVDFVQHPHAYIFNFLKGESNEQ